MKETILNKYFNCELCGKPIKHKGNCLGCNIKNKKLRESEPQKEEVLIEKNQ